MLRVIVGFLVFGGWRTYRGMGWIAHGLDVTGQAHAVVLCRRRLLLATRLSVTLKMKITAKQSEYLSVACMEFVVNAGNMP